MYTNLEIRAQLKLKNKRTVAKPRTKLIMFLEKHSLHQLLKLDMFLFHQARDSESVDIQSLTLTI